MMGEKEAARDVARQNMAAVEKSGCDYVITLCASCASHLKNGYPKLFAEQPDMAERVASFAEKVVPFSVFLNDVLKIESGHLPGNGLKTTYHAPCHLCRGLKVKDAPHALFKKAGLEFVPASEEETCCGFGGTYSSKFPSISAQILDRKLEDVKLTGAEQLVTECPGCIMQLRGGAKKRGDRIQVRHIVEALVKDGD
jgi:Fe-S oxidoreductase